MALRLRSAGVVNHDLLKAVEQSPRSIFCPPQHQDDVYSKRLIPLDCGSFMEGCDFAVRLLHYYSHVSFPLRNDWRSRPLPWWHPEGNHVQGSAVVALPTMPRWEDFIVELPSAAALYGRPAS